MVSLLLPVWRALGNVHLTIALCFLLMADFGLGYLAVRGNLEIFAPMNDVGLVEWLYTYGAANPLQSAWFFAMMALLLALAANTFICTTERVGQILSRRPAVNELPFRLAPHLMHYAVLIILGGYLFSYLFSASDPGRALRPGESIQLPDGGPSLRFEGFSPQYQEGARIAAFEGAVLEPNVQMRVRQSGQEHMAVLNFNEPIRVGGYGIYLNEFQPRRRRGGMGRSYVRLIIRRDPSSVIYRLGMGVFLVGLGLYVVGRSRRGRER